jgi:transcriptional regulator with XRE-family HTH domain
MAVFAIALVLRSASVFSVMTDKSSIACIENQALLHCPPKALLYAVGMAEEITVGQRIQIARKKRNLKQREVAKAAKVSTAAVSGWEVKGDNPEYKRLPAIAKVLRVPIAWLVAGTGEPPDDDPAVLLDSLTPAQLRQALRILKTLADDSEAAA